MRVPNIGGYMREAGEEWCRTHPMVRDIENDPTHFIPVRIFVDDAQVGKSINAQFVHWAPILSKKTPTRLARIPVL